MINPAARNVAVIGCGYVGYPLSLVLADAGHRVTAVDINPAVIEQIRSGTMLANEPGIPELARAVAEAGRLSVSTELGPADVFIIAVPTPLDSTRQKASLSAVRSATESIVPLLRPGNLVVVESTVPPRTCTNVVAPILATTGLAIGEDVFVAHCPERIFPGNTVEELRSVARVVGGVGPASSAAAGRFYESFVTGPLSTTDATTAEISKLMENTYRDVNIALANQVSAIAQTYKADPTEAIRIANQHPRVNYADAGIGVGGHCIPVDPWFLLDGTDNGGVIAAARSVNDAQPEALASLIAANLPDVESPRVVLVGAAYKPNVADIRESPALVIRDLLISRGIETVVYDPIVNDPAGNLTLIASGADLIAILVPHRRVMDEINDDRASIEGAMRHGRLIDVSTGQVRQT